MNTFGETFVIVFGALFVGAIGLGAGPAAGWSSANRGGGSTSHTEGSTSHTNAYGGSSTHEAGPRHRAHEHIRW